ncbi:hypothetical protein [Phytohabitans rumicis]|uniref:hypothetical protein n=1 Tax=Phytohabitans rumicis TaxID=1076125 RepID=UPI001566D8F7|nr:hypothetical protein [Phytohabitans rumicis]
MAARTTGSWPASRAARSSAATKLKTPKVRPATLNDEQVQSVPDTYIRLLKSR